MIEPLLTAQGISYRRDGHMILSEVHLSVQPGELVGLIGPNGAGKTTLLKVIGGLWSGAKGEITLLDRPLGRYSARDVAPGAPSPRWWRRPTGAWLRPAYQDYSEPYASLATFVTKYDTKALTVKVQ